MCYLFHKLIYAVKLTELLPESEEPETPEKHDELEGALYATEPAVEGGNVCVDECTPEIGIIYSFFISTFFNRTYINTIFKSKFQIQEKTLQNLHIFLIKKACSGAIFRCFF